MSGARRMRPIGVSTRRIGCGSSRNGAYQPRRAKPPRCRTCSPPVTIPSIFQPQQIRANRVLLPCQRCRQRRRRTAHTLRATTQKRQENPANAGQAAVAKASPPGRSPQPETETKTASCVSGEVGLPLTLSRHPAHHEPVEGRASSVHPSTHPLRTNGATARPPSFPPSRPSFPRKRESRIA